jgi:hypothetical protein
MGIAALLDEHFPTHGNWQGLSLGQAACALDWSDDRPSTSGGAARSVSRMKQNAPVTSVSRGIFRSISYEACAEEAIS